ncbi:MAG: Aminotran 5 protein [Bacteroidota bacterium]|nr:Aminotran 5 protein [Bacteroidota bacterium]
MNENNFGKSIRNLWYLDDSVIFLNHGSFGAAPKVVIEAAHQYQQRLERQPLSFFFDEYPEMMKSTIQKLHKFIGASPNSVAFVENASTGISTVLREFCPDFASGDEILTLNQAYPAIRNAMKYMAEKFQLKYVECNVPFPVYDNKTIIEAIAAGVTDRTRLAVIDHITSPTGIILPVREIAEMLKSRGVIVAIDGAHAPGMIPLDIESIGADFYTGNCHKWLFSPKGAALLWASEEYRDKLHPLCISLFYNKGFSEEFLWTGTKNPAPWLAVKDGIEFHQSLGSDELMKHNHDLAVEARKLIAGKLNIEIPVPDDFLGSIAALEMKGFNNPTHEDTMKLRFRMLKEFHIEVPFFDFDGRLWLRFSAQAYNELEEYAKLAVALKQMFY